MKKWPKQKDVQGFYGNPDINGDGQPDAIFERDNIIRIIPPYPMFWSWDLRPVKALRVHKKCADAMMAALTDIKNTFSDAEIKLYQLDRCGGAYFFKPMTGKTNLSMHAYGCAIDLAPELNGWKKTWKANSDMMPIEAVNCFKKHGATWGGLWHDADAMHFQFATV